MKKIFVMFAMAMLLSSCCCCNEKKTVEEEVAVETEQVEVVNSTAVETVAPDTVVVE